MLCSLIAEGYTDRLKWKDFEANREHMLITPEETSPVKAEQHLLSGPTAEDEVN
jgi:hypothetical protein